MLTKTWCDFLTRVSIKTMNFDFPCIFNFIVELSVLKVVTDCSVSGKFWVGSASINVVLPYVIRVPDAWKHEKPGFEVSTSSWNYQKSTCRYIGSPKKFLIIIFVFLRTLFLNKSYFEDMGKSWNSLIENLWNLLNHVDSLKFEFLIKNNSRTNFPDERHFPGEKFIKIM